MDPCLEALEDLEEQLHGLIALLESEEAKPADLESAVARCQERMSVLQEDREQRPDSAAVRDVSQRVLRLNAIAMSMVSAEFDGIGEVLRRASQTRRGLGYYTSPGAAGGSCDIAG